MSEPPFLLILKCICANAYFDKAKELIVENRPLVEALVKELGKIIT